MRSTRLRTAGVIAAIVMVIAGFAVSPPAGVKDTTKQQVGLVPTTATGWINVTLAGTTYVGGTTQQLHIDAYATWNFVAYSGAGTHEYAIYYLNHTLLLSPTAFLDTTDGHFNATVELKSYPTGTYTVWVNIYQDAENFGQVNYTLNLNHIYYFTGGPVATWEQDTDTVFISSTPFFTSEEINTPGTDDNIVPPDNVTSAKYEIHREGGAIAVEGTLTYNPTAKKWVVAGISMAWKGSGNFYAVAVFILKNGTILTSPNGAAFTRANDVENILTILGIAGGIGAAFLIVVAIYMKKRGSKDLGRKTKEKKKEKEIKVLDISKDEIKKAKQGKPTAHVEEPKEETKGVTKKSGDLIFEVPKWEEDDGEK